MSDERFWAQVDKDGPVPTHRPELGPCWMWLGSPHNKGYGRIQRSPRRVLTHRYAYELTIGPIPEGLTLDHLCRNRICCNPAHVEPVTHRVNILRGESPAATRARQTHCIRGHEFTAENTYVSLSNLSRRRCRECMRLYGQQRVP